jgi:hypothetical protein
VSMMDCRHMLSTARCSDVPAVVFDLPAAVQPSMARGGIGKRKGRDEKGQVRRESGQ